MLKMNKRDFLKEWDAGLEGNEPPGPVGPGMMNVHVFALIEYLTEKGYYTSRNDGVYGPMLKRAVVEFQDDNDLPLSGIWDERTVLSLEGREYIELPVGSTVVQGATIDSYSGAV
jgi:peptidoglycan hydrolase-like protein with peptidoglycan-binding domain